jgi:hypothetical protein
MRTRILFYSIVAAAAIGCALLPILVPPEATPGWARRFPFHGHRHFPSFFTTSSVIPDFFDPRF